MQKPAKKKIRELSQNVILLHEDKDLLIVDKPPGLLTMGTAKEKFRTVYSILSDYVKRYKTRSRVFIVHRLDRDTSGILAFAKSEKVKHEMQDNWDDAEKKYLAVVHGHPVKNEDTITSYLAESSANRVYATSDKSKGKLSKTHYRMVDKTAKFSLLEINLLTGRKHQIRVHLADAGYPVLGDKKYGKPEDKYSRLALHALSLSFIHPLTREKCFYQTRIPYFIDRLKFKYPGEKETLNSQRIE